jgi:FkbM family methyltransferase
MDSWDVLDTKTLFTAIIKKLKADAVFDIGSRDGDQSIFFREVVPNARVVAFEASPANYDFIVSKHLEARRIEVFPYAVSNRNGVSTFYLADVDSDPQAVGSSSLLPGGYALKEEIKVETCRIDDFTLQRFPEVQRLALWIDVESAEYEVLEGISKILDRVVVIHTETSIEPVRENQKPFRELVELMKSYGFTLSGSNITRNNIGDVVFVQDKVKSIMGFSYALCRFQARLYRHLPIGRTAVFLKKHFRPLYTFLRMLYIKAT